MELRITPASPPIRLKRDFTVKMSNADARTLINKLDQIGEYIEAGHVSNMLREIPYGYDVQFNMDMRGMKAYLKAMKA